MRDYSTMLSNLHCVWYILLIDSLFGYEVYTLHIVYIAYTPGTFHFHSTTEVLCGAVSHFNLGGKLMVLQKITSHMYT